MAIIDSLLEFSDAQAVTADAPSTNVIDLSLDRDIGPGRKVWVVVNFETALGGTSPTFQVNLQTDDNEGFASATTIAQSEVLSTVAAGDKLVMSVPYQNERYLRLQYDVGGTSPTATVNAWLTDQEPDSWVAYPDGQN